MKGRPINILLVEDDLAHAEIVRRNLTEFRVANSLVHKQDGQEALDYLFDEVRPGIATKLDLILLDLRLPKIDGLDVLRQLHADEVLSVIPTVILTTSTVDSDVEKAYQFGAGSYLVKPVDFTKFRDLMEVFGFYWLMWNRYPEDV